MRSAGVAAAVSAITVRLTDSARLDRLPGWRRQNYRGRDVSLAGGPAAALGSLAAIALDRGARRGARRPALLVGVVAALAGGYDDLIASRRESAGDKGLAGHLSAARAGRMSGGTVKVAAIGTSALLAAGALDRSGPWLARVADRVVRAAVIAGSANLLNLLDLRPGRAAKVALVVGLAGSSGPVGSLGAASAGAVAAILPGDLVERTMLGDLGANALGAVLGVRLAAGSRRTRVGAAAVIVALTAASERVSFSRVVDATPVLRRIDQLGRR